MMHLLYKKIKFTEFTRKFRQGSALKKGKYAHNTISM
jgi:hypothetical protein